MKKNFLLLPVVLLFCNGWTATAQNKLSKKLEKFGKDFCRMVNDDAKMVELGVLNNPFLQASANFYVGGKNSMEVSRLQYYAVQPDQSYIPWHNRDPTDLGNYLYFSFANRKTGRTFTFGVNHDKAQTPKNYPTYRYSNGGTEIVLMTGKIRAMKALDGIDNLTFYVGYRGGAFVSVHPIGASIPMQNDTLRNASSSYGYSGYGLIGNFSFGAHIRIHKNTGLSIVSSITGEAARTETMTIRTAGGEQKVHTFLAGLSICPITLVLSWGGKNYNAAGNIQ